ncbi:MAG: hypothetical protein HC855_07195 [Rhizobiales bacterium]|nr:hypothetical protein [Hyphomicrobiales bacterium]
MSHAWKLLIVALGFVGISAAPGFAAMTAEQCTALFTNSDTNADGSLGGEEGVKFEEAVKKTDVEIKDAGIVNKDEFMKSCEAGTFDGMEQ